MAQFEDREDATLGLLREVLNRLDTEGRHLPAALVQEAIDAIEAEPPKGA